MIKQLIFYLMVGFSMFFLFINNSPNYLDSSFLYYALSGVSFLVVFGFFYHFKIVFSTIIEKQLKSMQTKTSASWSSWFSENINEFTIIALVTTPYVVGLASISNGLAVWTEILSFLPMVSLIVMIGFSGLMIFLLLTTIYSIIFERNKPESFSIPEL